MLRIGDLGVFELQPIKHVEELSVLSSCGCVARIEELSVLCSRGCVARLEEFFVP